MESFFPAKESNRKYYVHWFVYAMEYVCQRCVHNNKLKCPNRNDCLDWTRQQLLSEMLHQWCDSCQRRHRATSWMMRFWPAAKPHLPWASVCCDPLGGSGGLPYAIACPLWTLRRHFEVSFQSFGHFVRTVELRVQKGPGVNWTTAGSKDTVPGGKKPTGFDCSCDRLILHAACHRRPFFPSSATAQGLPKCQTMPRSGTNCCRANWPGWKSIRHLFKTTEGANSVPFWWDWRSLSVSGYCTTSLPSVGIWQEANSHVHQLSWRTCNFRSCHLRYYAIHSSSYCNLVCWASLFHGIAFTLRWSKWYEVFIAKFTYHGTPAIGWIFWYCDWHKYSCGWNFKAKEKSKCHLRQAHWFARE